MSMHLLGPHMTTTKHSRKAKKNKTAKYAKAVAEHEAWLEKMGVGKNKGKKVAVNSIPDYKTKRVTSDAIPGNGVSKNSVKYTGTEIAGIVTTHKSNLMPIRKDNKQAAIDAANMRR